jgi:hypothetical protein
MYIMKPVPICLQLDRHEIERALSRAWAKTGEQDRGEDRYDGDHDEKLNQCEARANAVGVDWSHGPILSSLKMRSDCTCTTAVPVKMETTMPGDKTVAEVRSGDFATTVRRKYCLYLFDGRYRHLHDLCDRTRWIEVDNCRQVCSSGQGNISTMEVATEQVPDFFLLYAIESGLLEALAKSFPDPRVQQPEISLYLLLAAGIAGHLAGLYALSQLPYALHSPKLLAALGVQVVVHQPGKGISRKGTQQETAFHGDVVRKLLEQIDKHNTQEGRLPGQTLIDWYNTQVGRLFCQAVDAKPCVHILDCTDLCVPLKNENY